MVLQGALVSLASLPWSFMVCGILGLVLLWQASRLLDLLWWHPRRLERALRAQGLRGTSYRFLVGDLMDYVRRSREARSKSIPLRSHNIAPLVAPLLHDIVQEHGTTCLSWYAMFPKVTISDPDLTKEVLSDKFGHFEKPNSPALSRLLGGGFASYKGEKWVKHRRIINPAFHLEKLKIMLPAIWMSSQSSKLTGDVISRTAFGSNYLEGARIFQLQSEQLERIIAGSLKIGIPCYLYLPTKNNRKMHQINREIESIVHGLIGKRRQAMQGENAKDDLLSLMLESNMRNSNGQSILGMTVEEVVEECKMFYFAGTETTSILLTWTMIVLSMHPEWQDRAREEAVGLFGKNKLEHEDLSGLKTVTMVLYEVLRLYSPAVAFFRKTYKEMEIGGITYPAGVLIELPLLLMNHDPEIWGSDVHEFRPERFTNGISKASKNPGAFLPFGWGPRVCIAQQFALTEAKMALCMILRSFEFELGQSYTHAVDNTKLMRPLHGAQIKLMGIN
uniref:Uncharacterized protein n=1 Tax=Avena sativa TaxID=4498 RepID=A0ACD5UML0_AVESA